MEQQIKKLNQQIRPGDQGGGLGPLVGPGQSPGWETGGERVPPSPSPAENGFQHFAIAMVASPESLFLSSFVTKRLSECLALLSGLFQNQKGMI